MYTEHIAHMILSSLPHYLFLVPFTPYTVNLEIFAIEVHVLPQEAMKLKS
jgi:hypothetical protein